MGDHETTRFTPARAEVAALPVDPVVLRGGRVWIELSSPPPAHTWRVQSTGGGDASWRPIATSLRGGPHIFPDDPPAPRHLVVWRAVAVPELPEALAAWSASRTRRRP